MAVEIEGNAMSFKLSDEEMARMMVEASKPNTLEHQEEGDDGE